MNLSPKGRGEKMVLRGHLGYTPGFPVGMFSSQTINTGRSYRALKYRVCLPFGIQCTMCMNVPGIVCMRRSSNLVHGGFLFVWVFLYDGFLLSGGGVPE